MSTFGGITNDAVFNYSSDADSELPAITLTLNFNTINQVEKQNTPLVSPYGFVSIPDDNIPCLYAGSGEFYSAYVVGYINTQASLSNLSDMQKGESALFSKGNYTFKVKNDKLYVTFTNGSDEVINTRVTIDENVNTILIDTIAEIAALETKFNEFILAYNLHVHSGVTTGTDTSAVPTVLETDYTPTANFTRDQTFLGSSGTNNFINNDGELIT